MLSEQVIKVRKINERRKHFDDLIKEENKRIYDAMVEFNGRVSFPEKPSKLMRRVYGACYADTCYRAEEMIAYWEQRFIEDKARVLDDNLKTTLTLDEKCATF